MATTLKNYFKCDDAPTWHYFDLNPYYKNWWAELTSVLPTGIVEATDSITGSTVGFGVDQIATLADGTYTVTIQAREEDSTGTIIGSFDLIFEKSSTCAEAVDVGCCNTNAITIRWLGREGAIKQWYFNGVKEYDVRVGDANTFKNANRQLQYSERKDIYNGKLIYTKSITRDDVDFLDEVKYAIQVWEWDGTTATPILLDNDSFFKYKSKDKLFDLSIKYVTAQQIIVQTQ